MNNDFIYFDNLENLIPFLIKTAESNLLCELCGLIGIERETNKIIYKQMQNRSKDPSEFFMIDPYDYLSFIDKYECISVFHTHLLGNELPSEFDEKTSENCCYSFLIYSICSQKFHIYEPKNKDYDVNIIQRLKELI